MTSETAVNGRQYPAAPHKLPPASAERGDDPEICIFTEIVITEGRRYQRIATEGPGLSREPRGCWWWALVVGIGGLMVDGGW